MSATFSGFDCCVNQMTTTKKKKLWVAGGVAIAILVIAVVGMIVRQANASLGNRGPAISDQALDDQLKSKDVVVVGAVESAEGGAIENAAVTLSLHNGDGQVVWRLTKSVSKDGSFKIQLQDLPNIPNLYAGTIAAEAPNHLAEKANVSVDIVKASVADQLAKEAERTPPSPPAGAQASPAISLPRIDSEPRKTSISPQRVRLRLAPYTPWLTLLVLVPAIFGLLLAILHLTQFSRGIWVTYWYAMGTAALWGLIVAGLVWLYVGGKGLIPLFWPDFFVSSGVIIFAFIGNIIYVAYTISEKRHSFFDSDDKTRKRLLLTLGGRILVAPYIALAAYGIFAATFPTLRTGPFAAFFGFFAGLWIKPVLEALNDIGLRLLSVEERQRVAAEATRAENRDVPRQQTSSAVSLRPEQAFLDAVNAAREDLLKKEGVIGVAPGFKESAAAGKTGERAIVAYVYEKQEPENSADRVPETIMGYPTDVVPLPRADQSEECRDVALCLSWEKLNRDNEERLRREGVLPHDAPIERFGQVPVLTDTTLFMKVREDHYEFDVKRAYQSIRPTIGDGFDFVAFIIDPKMGEFFYQNNVSIPIFNNVSGINHFRGNSYSVRSEWGAQKLLACQVISPLPLPISFRTFIHEVAHSWCAYVTFNDPAAPQTNPNYDLLIGKQEGDPRYHWNQNFLNQRSCMGKERFEWIANADGTFTQSPVKDQDFSYCELDLYLMGLIPPEDVHPLRILQNPTQVGSGPTFSATTRTVTIDQIIKSCGTRIPPRADGHYRQALIVVSNTPANGLDLARTVEEKFRKQYEDLFVRATRNHATLSTTIG